MKFADEVRFCFGAAIIKINDADRGVRLAPFECSRNKVVLSKKIMQLSEEETKGVKTLQGKTAPWCVPTRLPNFFCLIDLTKSMQVVAKKKAKN